MSRKHQPPAPQAGRRASQAPGKGAPAFQSLWLKVVIGCGAAALLFVVVQLGSPSRPTMPTVKPPTPTPGQTGVSQLPVTTNANFLQFPQPAPNPLAPRTETLDETAARLLNEGEELHRMGQYDQAIQRYQEAIKIKPEDEDLYYNLAITYATKGMTNEAIQAYQQTLKIVPEYLEARNNLGNLFAHLGRFREAREHFDYVLNVNPDDARAHNNLGTLLARQGQRTEAMVKFRLAIQLDTNYVEARINLASGLLLDDQVNDAVRELEAAAALQPDSDTIRQRLAKARQIQAMKASGAGPLIQKP